MSDGVLRVDHLSAGYGDTQVLWDISFELAPGEIVAIIGSKRRGQIDAARCDQRPRADVVGFGDLRR